MTTISGSSTRSAGCVPAARGSCCMLVPRQCRANDASTLARTSGVSPRTVSSVEARTRAATARLPRQQPPLRRAVDPTPVASAPSGRRAARSATPIGVSPVFDPQDSHHPHLIVDLTEDSVWAASRRPPPRKLPRQRLAHPLRALAKVAGQEFVDCRRNGRWQTFAQRSRGRWSDDDAKPRLRQAESAVAVK